MLFHGVDVDVVDDDDDDDGDVAVVDDRALKRCRNVLLGRNANVGDVVLSSDGGVGGTTAPVGTRLRNTMPSARLLGRQRRAVLTTRTSTRSGTSASSTPLPPSSTP
jgi:hypothetical protein